MKLANEWKEYKILDMAEGQKLERWGDVVLSRPDPQIIWKQKSYPEKWKSANAIYNRSKTGGGAWEYNKKMPNQWQIKYKELTFILSIKPGIKSFDKQWIESIEKSDYKEFLTESDLNEIKSIGIGLGKSDKLVQSAHLKLHKKMLSQKLTEAKQEGTVKGRLYRKVGILTGIAGAIMLM